MNRSKVLRTLGIPLVFVVIPLLAATSYFQGFETDTFDWSAATQVASGTGGVPSAAGAFHAEVPDGAFTRYGGYESAFPACGYVASIDIYLNMATTVANDTRFDFSSAISQPNGTHRRDFVFSGGFYNDTDATGSGPRFVFTASNNVPGWPKNPARSPFAITETGWYTLQHSFRDAGGGVLAVDMSILNSSGVVLTTWTLSDPSDIIGSTVGGHRYGWFPGAQPVRFPSFLIDNVRLASNVCPVRADAAFHVRYVANLNVVDSLINVTNTGANGAMPFGPGIGPNAGNICVNVYAFSPDEQMVGCCSCHITPNGLASLSVYNDIRAITLTGLTPNSMVIKLVTTATGGTRTAPSFTGGASACLQSAAGLNVSHPVVPAGMVAWSTTGHVPGAFPVPGAPAPFAITETAFTPATLSEQEIISLNNRCTAIIGNGSTFGTCRTCSLGGRGAGKF